MRKPQTTVWLGVLAAFVALPMSAQPVHGFYWRGWPGSGIVVEPVLVDPHIPTPGNPPAEPIPFPGTENNYTPPVGPVPPPESVPEPATGLAGLLGLGAIAVVKRLRKKSS